MAKLKARFRQLVQPTPKPPQRPINVDKPTATAVTPRDASPPAVTVRIPLPKSNETQVAKQSSPSLHGLYAADEDSPSTMPGDTTRQPGIVPAGQAQSAGTTPTDSRSAAATSGEIEQWPHSPQSAVKTVESLHTAAPKSEFDAMPIEEYRAAVAKAAGGADPVPAFHKEKEAANSSASTSPAVASATTAQLHDVPKVQAPAAESRPALIPIEQAESHAAVVPQTKPPAPVDLLERDQPQQLPPQIPPAPVPAPAADPEPVPATAPAPATQVGLTQGAAPAVPMSATAPAPVVPVRSPQGIGGRYGQPAWMSAAAATPAGN